MADPYEYEKMSKAELYARLLRDRSPSVEKSTEQAFGMKPRNDRWNLIPHWDKKEGLIAPELVYGMAKALSTAKAASEGANVSPEDALNFAGNVGGGGIGTSSVMRNAAPGPGKTLPMVIGSRLAKGNEALEDSLKAAERLVMKIRKAHESAEPSKGARGVSDLVQGDPRINDRLVRETGWWYDPESRQWMTEIDDSRSMPDFQYMEEAEMNKMFGDPDQTLSLADVLRHPELEKLPEGQSFMTKLGVVRDPTMGAKRGMYSYDTDSIYFGDPIEPASMGDIRDTMYHEVQHAIAGREGFKPGSNVKASGSYEKYLKDPGEMLARVAALRRNMTPEARRKFPFHRHMSEETYRLSLPEEQSRYATFVDLKRLMNLRNMDPNEMLVPGP